MEKDFKKKITRDFLALGSWVFYFLVIGRALIEPYRPFVDQIIIAGIILILSSFIIKKYDDYISKGLVLVVFTILFYEDRIFSIFAILVFIGLIFSSYILGNEKRNIIKGVIIGVVSTLIGYYLGNFSLSVV